MLKKIKRVLSSSPLNTIHGLGTIYYKMKGIVLYRFLFKKFGKGSVIRKPLLILNPDRISIGDRVSIREGIRLEVVRSNERRIPWLSIDNDTNIEQNVHIVCHSRVRIGAQVSITGNCCIVDVTHPFRDIDDSTKIGARILDEDSFVEIGDGAFIGFGSVILPNVRIGRCVVIGANSVVTRDVPDYCVATGAPAMICERYDFAEKAWVKSLG